MVITQTLFTFFLSHICCKVIYWCAAILHVGQEMLTLSGTPDFNPFGEFMISPIHYIYMYYQIHLSVSVLYLRINDYGLFAWISHFPN